MISHKSEKGLKLIFYYLLLCATSILILIPLIIVISSAFKHETEIFSYAQTLFPKTPTLDNFIQLERDFPSYIFNSFKLTTIISAIQFITATTGAYAFSKLQWKGRDVVFFLYVSSIMIPVQSIIIPQFTIIRMMHLYDTHLSLILVSSFTAFGTFLMRQFFLSVPDPLLEAARIDGASEFRIFISVMLPLSKPAIATLLIFSFRYFWNDFFTPLIFLTSKNLKTLPLGLSDFVSEATVLYGPQMAAALISILPVMLIFLFAQRYFVEGIATTGIKG